MNHSSGFDFNITPTEWVLGLFIGWMDDWKATGVRQFTIQFLCFCFTWWWFQDVKGYEPVSAPEDDDIAEKLDAFLQELPQEIVERGVAHIKSKLNPEIVRDITSAWKADPKTWWAAWHHGWGTGVRNDLRDNVCRDDELPSGNWDDYYVQLVEIAVGVRDERR